MSIQRFLVLLNEIDQSMATSEKEDAMVRYFRESSDADSAWAIFLLTGRKRKRLASSTALKELLSEFSQVPTWLVEESYHSVGDLAETIALIVTTSLQDTHEINLAQSFAEFIEESLSQLQSANHDLFKSHLFRIWSTGNKDLIFAYMKVVTGGFRIGVSAGFVHKALAKAYERPLNAIEDLMIGDFTPGAEFVQRLKAQDSEKSDVIGRPYPFCLAHPLSGNCEELGSPDEWTAEWKWDGIRGQIVKDDGKVWIWSRGEELVSPSFPDLLKAAESLPDGIHLDGEIVAWDDSGIATFSKLQKRLGRKNPSTNFCSENPIAFIAYDCLRVKGTDIRSESTVSRRENLLSLLKDAPAMFRVSETIAFPTWDYLRAERHKSRLYKVEGLMLKRKEAPYTSGRKAGIWFKWKIDPFQIDAVLLYAQPGHGRRANLYTDYTFAVWDGEKLVPFTKAYSGLTDEEIRSMDHWIRNNTKEKFGPVRSVKPQHVFELHFEGINASSRHKSGVALRFPRISRHRTDKKVEDADHLSTLKALLNEKNHEHAEA